jgi:ABC-type nickel/cobalt efflux system permease component RcnA
MTTALPLLALQMPSLDMLIIAALASCLPVAFFVWLNWWLSSVKDENPDQVIAEQAKADREHLAHHGHGHDHAHAHAHAHGSGHAHA